MITEEKPILKANVVLDRNWTDVIVKYNKKLI
jgi:hypothetical protein